MCNGSRVTTYLNTKISKSYKRSWANLLSQSNTRGKMCYFNAKKVNKTSQILNAESRVKMSLEVVNGSNVISYDENDIYIEGNKMTMKLEDFLVNKD